MIKFRGVFVTCYGAIEYGATGDRWMYALMLLGAAIVGVGNSGLGGKREQ